MLTFRGRNAPRMESVRVQVAGRRIKATGRIVGGDCAEHSAFSASYDLVTDESGVTRRLSLRTSVAGGERHTSIQRDTEGYWLVGDGESRLRSRFGGALDVDVVLSSFFNALPIRRLGLHTGGAGGVLPVVYVYLPDLTVREADLTYTVAAAGLHVQSPVASSTLTVDSDGFVTDYEGLATRI
ncbi:MAG: putative glycolipid-binding domain-containing protein [Mycobacteriaceae bacterium]|nr:putative glycolipid-binding domain-containing protein [Mycobacteriaceae bacterium]